MILLVLISRDSTYAMQPIFIPVFLTKGSRMTHGTYQILARSPGVSSHICLLVFCGPKNRHLLMCSLAKMLGIFEWVEGLELRDGYAYAYTCNPGPSLQPLSAFLQKTKPRNWTQSAGYCLTGHIHALVWFILFS